MKGKEISGLFSSSRTFQDHREPYVAVDAFKYEETLTNILLQKSKKTWKRTLLLLQILNLKILHAL